MITLAKRRILSFMLARGARSEGSALQYGVLASAVSANYDDVAVDLRDLMIAGFVDGGRGSGVWLVPGFQWPLI